MQRLKYSVPIISELKAGRARDIQAVRALAQAENYVTKCPVSPIPHKKCCLCRITF
jgi:hypothetical protein